MFCNVIPVICKMIRMLRLIKINIKFQQSNEKLVFSLLALKDGNNYYAILFHVRYQILEFKEC